MVVPPQNAPVRRPPTWSILLIAAAVAGVYVGLPQVAGLDETWGRLSSGDPLWLGAAALLEVASYAAYVLTFHRLFERLAPCGSGGGRATTSRSPGWPRPALLALAGAGGIALTAWALRRSGMGRRALASGLTAFYAVLPAIFMAALVLVGTGLWTGLLSGPAPFGLTVVPALFGGLVIASALLTVVLPRASTVGAGVRGALELLRDRDPALLGALGWWAFDVSVLAACFRAFGGSPPGGVVVMAYFTGMIANVLPFPGGNGGVGGHDRRVPGVRRRRRPGGHGRAGLSRLRIWLPMIPGALAYVRLRRTVTAWERTP